MKFKNYAIKPKYLTSDAPLVITLHGMGSNYLDLPPIINDIKQQVNNINIQAGIKLFDGYAFYLPNGNDFVDEKTLTNVANKLHQYIIDSIEEHELKPSQIYLLGFSQGCIIANVLLSLFPSFYTGAVLLNGCLAPFLENNKTIQKHYIFIAQGLSDPIFDVTNGQKMRDYYKEKKSNVTYKEYAVGHGVNYDGVQDINYFLLKAIDTHQKG